MEFAKHTCNVANAGAGKMAKTVLLTGVLTGILVSAQLFAQELAPLQLEAPILPAGMPAAQPAPLPVGTSIAPITQGIPSEHIQPASYVGGCSACGSVGCGGCDEFAGPGFQAPPSGLGLWIRADYLNWHEKESDFIPLVTSSTGFTADPEDLLTIGAAETRILFGGEEVGDNPLDGWRLEIGTWLDAAATYGIMGRYFDVAGRDITFESGPGDTNFLGIPFFDPDVAGEDALDLIIPNERTGQVNVNLRGDVKNWEILFRRLADTGCNYRFDLLYGYRNFSMDETLTLNATTLTTGGTASPLDTLIELNDRFDVENRFHGLDFGLTGHSHQGCWSLDFLMKVAIGVMEKEVDVSGSQLISIPGLDVVRNVGGLFSQESNIGQNDESDFAVIPEFNVNLGYGITPNLDVTVGYTFIYVSEIVRAGSAIDRVVDPGLIADLDPVNSNRPLVNLDGEGYFLHGLNIGVTGRF